jgi:hypothetical protein
MDNLDDSERQIAANRERRRREQGSQEEIDNENDRIRLNYTQSNSERDTY